MALNSLIPISPHIYKIMESLIRPHVLTLYNKMQELRGNTHLLEMARSIQFQAHFPIHFWGYSLLASTYIINRLPTPILHNKSPYELLHNSPPTLDHLRTIGCLAYAYNHTTDKFDHRGTPTVLIGYPNNQKGYLLYDLKTHKTITSRSVLFDEDISPFSETKSTQSSTTPSPSPHVSYTPNNISFIPTTPPASSTSTIPFEPSAQQQSQPHTTNSPISSNHPSPQTTPSPTPTESVSESSPILPSPSPTPAPPPLRTSTRTKQVPSKLKDFHYQLPKSTVHNTHNHKFHNIHYINYLNLCPSSLHLINNIDKHIEPTSFKQAIKNPKWVEAVNKEIVALEQNGTCILIELPPGKIPIG
jgi:hypothetical protein